jgi:hypothetical protein
VCARASALARVCVCVRVHACVRVCVSLDGQSMRSSRASESECVMLSLALGARLVRTGFLEDMAKKGLTDLRYFKYIGTRATKDEDGPFSLQTSTKVRTSHFQSASPPLPSSLLTSTHARPRLPIRVTFPSHLRSRLSLSTGPATCHTARAAPPGQH